LVAKHYLASVKARRYVKLFTAASSSSVRAGLAAKFVTWMNYSSSHPAPPPEEDEEEKKNS
jgi:hypothetical protein